MNWNFCNEHEHEYAEYFSETFRRVVCFTCDPESENNRHRPSAQEAIYATEFARKGGQAKSPAKTKAAMENGKKGGRPKAQQKKL